MARLNNWFAAKKAVPRCVRCDEWEKAGLSNRCPACDEKIIAHFNALEADTPETLSKHEEGM